MGRRRLVDGGESQRPVEPRRAGIARAQGNGPELRRAIPDHALHQRPTEAGPAMGRQDVEVAHPRQARVVAIGVDIPAADARQDAPAVGAP